jgi:hypothetical protein
VVLRERNRLEADTLLFTTVPRQGTGVQFDDLTDPAAIVVSVSFEHYFSVGDIE